MDICILTQSSFPIIVIPPESFTFMFLAEVSFFFFYVCVCFFLNYLPYSSKDSLMPFRLKQLKVRLKEGAKTTRAGCNASNFLFSWSLNVCALSLPPYHRINLLFHLPVPPPFRSLIHLISASWSVQSLPPLSPCLLQRQARAAGCSVFRGRCVSGGEWLCRWQGGQLEEIALQPPWSWGEREQTGY